MAVLSENKHSIVIVANILSERIGEIYNVLILYILSLKSSVETSRLQWLEKNNQEKRHSGGQTLELLCVPFSFRDSEGGGRKNPREHHIDTEARRAPRARGIFVLEMLQRKEESVANNSRILANLSCFYYQGRNI